MVNSQLSYLEAWIDRDQPTPRMIFARKSKTRNVDKFFESLDLRLYDIDNDSEIGMKTLIAKEIQPNTFDYFKDKNGNEFREIILYKKKDAYGGGGMWRASMNNWSLQIKEIKQQRVTLYNLKVDLDPKISDLEVDKGDVE